MRLTERQGELLRMVRDNPGLHGASLAKKLMCHDGDINARLRVLAKWGLIRSESRSNRKHWFIVD